MTDKKTNKLITKVAVFGNEKSKVPLITELQKYVAATKMHNVSICSEEVNNKTCWIYKSYVLAIYIIDIDDLYKYNYINDLRNITSSYKNVILLLNTHSNSNQYDEVLNLIKRNYGCIDSLSITIKMNYNIENVFVMIKIYIQNNLEINFEIFKEIYSDQIPFDIAVNNVQNIIKHETNKLSEIFKSYFIPQYIIYSIITIISVLGMFGSIILIFALNYSYVILSCLSFAILILSVILLISVGNKIQYPEYNYITHKIKAYEICKCKIKEVMTNSEKIILYDNIISTLKQYHEQIEYPEDTYEDVMYIKYEKYCFSVYGKFNESKISEIISISETIFD